MLLIYSTHTSPRLQYICHFIFKEMLKTSFSLTLHKDSFSKHDGPKINYSEEILENAYQIAPQGLLFQENISDQNIEVSGEAEQTIFFKGNGDHSFDIFAATFYLISRYEEYLPHRLDMYGRYAHENSLAFSNNFLHLPLANIWINDFKKKLTEKFKEIKFQEQVFTFQPSYDIDIAWSFKEKGFLRTAGGFIRKPSVGRITTLLGLSKDPFDSYGFLDKLHASSGLNPVYFFLVALKNSKLDRHILPSIPAMQELIKSHSAKYETGLHPSLQSNESPEKLKEEKILLEEIIHKRVNSSRQHFIKLTLPDTYQNLSAVGISNDYSMGYGSINGFRASVASSFFWYDLANEKITSLRIHPFCFMDANCFYEQKLSVEESFLELMNYYKICKKVNGHLITIFHNNFLGNDKQFAGWKELYTKFIAQVQQ